MNRTLLAELQTQRSYPSVTLLLNTTPRRPLDSTQMGNAKRLVDQVMVASKTRQTTHSGRCW